MAARRIRESDNFKRCVAFHGHTCPGLAIGYAAAVAAMKILEECRSVDEEMVCIVETDACAVDAVQVLTGCTFGKGNLVYRDYGKMAFTFLSRADNRGVRLVLREGALPPDEEAVALRAKIVAGSATDADRNAYRRRQDRRIDRILTAAPEELFTIAPAAVDMPAPARIDVSVSCARCGEPTMRAKLENVAGELVCRGCLDRGV
ncbi:MAG: formylmethanofuran dehydrogenase [Deltaproteobacteria bacterium]|nr:formylmethanofuran dehydrogenase [Candidatus Anaeroferrophillacea bacterium]